jgi:hypothetical protein
MPFATEGIEATEISGLQKKGQILTGGDGRGFRSMLFFEGLFLPL